MICCIVEIDIPLESLYRLTYLHSPVQKYLPGCFNLKYENNAGALVFSIGEDDHVYLRSITISCNKGQSLLRPYCKHHFLTVHCHHSQAHLLALPYMRVGCSNTTDPHSFLIQSQYLCPARQENSMFIKHCT